MKWYYIIILVILIILICIGIYYMWKKNENNNTIEPYQTSVSFTRYMLDSLPVLTSIVGINSHVIKLSNIDKYYLITTLYATLSDPVWTKKIISNNIKYILDYNIAKETSATSYYILSVESKQIDNNKFNNLNILGKTCYIGIKPITFFETVNNIQFKYYFMGCTVWYTAPGNVSSYSSLAQNTFDNITFNNINKPNTISTSLYCNIETKYNDFSVSASYVKLLTPLCFNDYYLINDNTNYGFSQTGTNNSIYYNKATGNIIPMVGTGNSSSMYLNGPLNNYIFGPKMDNFLSLMLYPDISITWTVDPCYYFLNASWIKDNNTINKYVNLNPLTGSIIFDTNPNTNYLKIIGTYTISGQTKKCVKYIAFLNDGNKILGIKSCNAETNTDFNTLTTFTIDMENTPIDFTETDLNLMNYRTPPLWHNYKKPWHVLDASSMNFIGTSYGSQECGLYTDETVIYGMRSQQTNFYKVTLSSVDIKIPTTTDLSIKDLYAYKNNYYTIIPYHESDITYYNIIKYPELTQFPTTTSIVSTNTFFRGELNNNTYTFEKKYYEFNDMCVNIKIFDTTDTNIQFIKYIRSDPFDNYIEDTTYTIDKLPNNIFKKYTKDSDNENLSLFIDTDNNLILSYNIDTDTFELITNITPILNTTTTLSIGESLTTNASVSEFDARNTNYKQDKFIYYKNQVRFKNINENYYGIYEFPLQSIQLTTKMFSITKYIPTTTAYQTTTTLPTTTAYETTTTAYETTTTAYGTTTTAYEPTTTAYGTTTTAYETTTTAYGTTTTAYEPTTTAYETTTTAYETTTTAYEPTTTVYESAPTTAVYNSDNKPPTKPTGNLIYFN